ncbi:MAG: transposase [Chthoniobacterales bacterium]
MGSPSLNAVSDAVMKRSGNFNGILQTDGYSGYDRVGGPKLIHAGFWAHARRYFFQAVEAHPDDRAPSR